MAKILALVDCNNFFVSCERLFRPELEGRPVVVLSSNDGCAVARSNEAKALGIPMGAPAFQYRQLFKDHQVVQFSANFELYADLSRRITQLLSRLTPQIEVYSIDESFLDLSQLGITDYAAWGRQLRNRIWREIGLPVSVGIASSKTLAKLASEQAKHHDSFGGACAFVQASDSQRQAMLANTPVEQIWGVGRRLAPKLKAAGLHNALALSQISPALARQLVGSKHGAQLVAELNGLSCINLAEPSTAQKSIMRGRTFGEDTGQFHVLEAAVANLSSRAAFQLRQTGQLASSAGLLLNTSRFKPGYQSWWLPVQFTMPTNDNGVIMSRLIEALRANYQAGLAYHRANVLLADLVAADQLQTDLLGEVDVAADQRSQQRMQAIDTINQRYGSARLRYAAEGLSATWQPKRQLRSPRYTTQWAELPEAKLTS